jgi:RimJ/RimL family protein N-acetyltransferase
MDDLKTERLVLIPCRLELVQALMSDRAEAEALIAASIPAEWPLHDLAEFLPAYAAMLEADPEVLGYGVWLLIAAEERELVGDAGFIGRPTDGEIEIGYSILPAKRGRGYATEATAALLQWGLAREDVTRIVAGCAPDNLSSTRVLEKLGMQRSGGDERLLRWSTSGKI